MPKILLTGGGTAGHVTPNLALIPYLREAGFEIEYMGSYNGIERELVEGANIPYVGISTGKLRRYLSKENLKDIFRVPKGYFEARKYMKNHRPDVVFSKGGYVSVPVIFAASHFRVPIVIHESDLTPGLANKLSIPRADKICYSFPESGDYLPKDKSFHTGLPVRRELLSGNKKKGLEFCGIEDDGKPILLVIGGSLGSANINAAVRESLDELLNRVNIIHICGHDKTDPSLDGTRGYAQFEYVDEELPDLFAAADIAISRAGANVIYELVALRKPAILIPLGTNASRGDQILNANSFKKHGYSEVLMEEDMTPESLCEKLDEALARVPEMVSAMEAAGHEDSAKAVCDVICSEISS